MTQIIAFDYAALDAETRIVVQQRTTEIRALGRKVAADIFEMGQKYAEVRDLLRHNKNGGFEGWIEAEGFKKRFVYNCIGVYVAFANSANFAQLDIAVSALYLLVAPSTPEEAREEVIEMAAAGLPVGYTAAKQIIAAHKPMNSHRSGVSFAGEGAEPDLDENGQPLTRRYVEADEEEELRAGDVVQYGGQRFTLRSVASSGRVYFDVPKSHKLYGRGIESEDVLRIERAADRRKTLDAPPPPAIPPVAPPLAEEIVQIDGIPVAETHPEGFALFFGGSGWATCVNCGASHPRWTPVRGSDWRCEQPNCKKLTHDDLMIEYTKSDADAEDRQARRSTARNGNGHKPAADPVVDEPKRQPAQSVHYSSESPEWYTPPEIAALVRDLMPINLDPASCYAAQQVIRADHYFDAQMNGLHPMRRWDGRVFLNPPYGREIGKWVERLIDEYKKAHTVEAILLAPARSDTEWFGLLRDYPRCFVTGRLKFWTGNAPDEQQEAAPFPSAIFYLGNRFARFAETFSTIGDIYTLWRPQA